MLLTRAKRVRPAFLKLLRYRRASTDTRPSVAEDSPRSALGSTIKPIKRPFLPNALIGKVDKDFLIYPETVDLNELDERFPLISNPSPEILSELEKMSSSEKAKFYVQSGLPLTSNDDWKESERVKLYENADLDMSTALLMETQALVVDVITRFGNEATKNKYLGPLLKGEITGAFAMSENSSGSDPSSLETLADYDDEKGEFRLTGEKRWVTNGQKADFYLVVASTPSPHSHQTPELNALLVDASSSHIDVVDETPCELSECGLSKLCFRGTSTPECNLIGDPGNGFEVSSSVMGRNRYFLMSSLLNSSKKHFKNAIQTVLNRKQYPLPLRECQLVQSKIAEIGYSIYALESTLYLHSGILDLYNVDLSIESAALQLFCFETTLNALETCNDILGGTSFDGNHPYMKLITQTKGAFLASKTQNLLQLYVGLMSSYYAGKEQSETIKKWRNPLEFPAFVVGRMMKFSRLTNDDPKLDLKLFTNLHPSLKGTCEGLEYTVLRLQYAFEIVISRYGQDFINTQNDLCRVANVLRDIYAMTAVLSRASRSYCTGIRWSDDEVRLANAFCLNVIHRVKLELAKLIDGGFVSNDVERLKLGTEILNKGEYFVEHPLVKNIS